MCSIVDDIIIKIEYSLTLKSNAHMDSNGSLDGFNKHNLKNKCIFYRI